MTKFKFEVEVSTQVEIEANSVEEARRKFLASEFSDVFDIGEKKGDIMMFEGSAELAAEPGMKPMPFEIDGNSVEDVIFDLADLAYEIGCLPEEAAERALDRRRQRAIKGFFQPHYELEITEEMEAYYSGAIAKAIFKGSDCGCVFGCDTKGITLAGYAEGADAECPNHRLDYPFSPHEFWTTLEEADAEGVQMWHEWNDEEEDV